MARVQEKLQLHRPLDEVWGLFIDPDRWLEWNTELADLRDVRGPFDRPGSGYTQVWRLARWEREGSWQVIGCEPRRWREVAGMTPIGLAFEAREEFGEVTGGSQVTVQIRWATRVAYSDGSSIGSWRSRCCEERCAPTHGGSVRSSAASKQLMVACRAATGGSREHAARQARAPWRPPLAT